MKYIFKYPIGDINKWYSIALKISDSFQFSTILNSNNHQGDIDFIAGFSNNATLLEKEVFEGLKNAYTEKEWYFFALTYDAKMDVENISTKNNNPIQFPNLTLFKPELLIQVEDNQIIVSTTLVDFSLEKYLGDLEKKSKSISFLPTTTKADYLDKIRAIKRHIQRGDIYEMNFCQEFYSPKVGINPASLYLELLKNAPTPFSSFFKCKEQYLMSASPERFIKKFQNKLTSQPIKGTLKRGATIQEDEDLKDILRNSLKDQNENVMIVDLVRNDLSRVCKPGTVKVEELFGIYTFSHVHQMISTITGELDETLHPIDAIKKCFPMGSMTGAPKVRALELIEQFESKNRGLYSGTVGYIDPKGNFDSNVIIRSLMYNANEKYLSFWVGGAITQYSNPENEYEECMVKAASILKTLNAHVQTD